MTDEQLIESYVNYHSKVLQLAKTTVTYARLLAGRWLRFLRAMGIRGFSSVTASALLDWIDERRSTGGVKDRTIEREVATIRSLHEYFMNFHHVPDPLYCLPSFMCIRSSGQEYLKVKEVFRLLRTCDKRSFISFRNYVIIALLWCTGLRSRELCALRWNDIDLENSLLLVRKGKGNKQRQLFLNNKMLRILKSYRRSMVDAGERTPVFRGYCVSRPAGAKPRALSIRALGDVVRQAVHEAGIDRKVTPLILRHTFATHMYEAGVPLNDIKEMMGHDNRTETTIYIHVTLDAMRNCLYKHVGARMIKERTCS